MINIKSIFCRHDYIIQEIKHVKSDAEYLISVGLIPNTHTSFKRGMITLLKCSKCNKFYLLKGKI